ncbi:hypothetical protein ACRALDRAFT_207132 [Sodiomyces alcalophilus JCM 7366]|uniref:uncharacterized protein n=1 Tax=Sodiomyces alcalophilus JCM 7366 TaxID=591952 RepID=UPI0039B668CF
MITSHALDESSRTRIRSFLGVQNRVFGEVVPTYGHDGLIRAWIFQFGNYPTLDNRRILNACYCIIRRRLWLMIYRSTTPGCFCRDSQIEWFCLVIYLVLVGFVLLVSRHEGGLHIPPGSNDPRQAEPYFLQRLFNTKKLQPN